MEKQSFIFGAEIKPDEIETEDGGQAKIITVAPLKPDYDDESGMFVRIQSWDESTKHEQFSRFVGRKVLITIETID